MPAQDENILILPQLDCTLLAEGLSLWGHIDDMRFGCNHFTHRLVAVVDWLGLHQHPLAAAVRGIIHPAVLVLGVVADVVTVYLQFSCPSCPSDDAFT